MSVGRADTLILTKLSKRLPRVQFIGTTHSPMTLVKCQPGEVISCRLSNAVATAEQDLPLLEGHTADQILRGAWFGLKETMAPETEALLARYRAAIEHKHSETELRHLRDEIRQKVGSLAVGSQRFGEPSQTLAEKVLVQPKRAINLIIKS